ncbi:hypothetical protein H8S95_16190 [Pontibacter sp. KCTC 32443]|uniref:hypothetical protein n=1 Tax=Pontibacter TaxID=323449 RepID=UPI00164DD390|nr:MULTISPECIES: hypothetical protein [Pontibacter]MBC5775618.1 hypothetical protein [Pontibacter sp. KCTC 32443]
MKTKTFSFVIALIALFSLGVYADCHQVQKLSISTENNTISISGKIAGLGNVNEEVDWILSGSLTGEFQCISPGQRKQDPGSESPGLTTYDFSASGSGVPRNGNLLFTASDTGPCTYGNGKFEIRLLNPSFSGYITVIYPDGSECTSQLSF